jgi:hypothetical protein
MELISHRGNLNSINPDLENSPDYIDNAILEGFDVEVDVRCVDGKLFLGHDYPQYEINERWLIDRKRKLWIHTKDFNSLNLLIRSYTRIFFHEKESHTIIHNTNQIWSHNIDEASENSIIPLLSKEDVLNWNNRKKVYGVCSDYIKLFR